MPMNVPASTPVQELQRHCTALPPGPVADVPTMQILLAAAWDDLESDDGGMTCQKLSHRMEDVVWNAPFLGFKVERHGSLALGGTRGELQHWQVDVGNGIATLGKIGW